MFSLISFMKADQNEEEIRYKRVKESLLSIPDFKPPIALQPIRLRSPLDFFFFLLFFSKHLSCPSLQTARSFTFQKILLPAPQWPKRKPPRFTRPPATTRARPWPPEAQTPPAFLTYNSLPIKRLCSFGGANNKKAAAAAHSAPELDPLTKQRLQRSPCPPSRQPRYQRQGDGDDDISGETPPEVKN